MPADRPAVAGRALRAAGVTAGYGADPVIRGISVDVEPGQVVSLVGANGSGKSTLLKSLVGVVRMTSGRVSVGDADVTGWPPEAVARLGVGYVPQVDDVFGPLTVRENLEMGGYLLPARQVRQRVDEVVAVFPRLAGMLTRKAGKLSGGERKMLALGRVLMLAPSVFLLDEPTASLAPAVARTLLEEHVRGLARGGACVLIVEQRARAVLAISDRTYVLAAARSGWPGPRPNWPPARPSSSPSSAARSPANSAARQNRCRRATWRRQRLCPGTFVGVMVVGRPEKSLDPTAGSVQQFAAELREVRELAGRPTYRQLAAQAHYSSTVLSRAAAGKDLPSLAVTLAFVEACGGDCEAWTGRWQAARDACAAAGTADAASLDASEPGCEEIASPPVPRPAGRGGVMFPAGRTAGVPSSRPSRP